MHEYDIIDFRENYLVTLMSLIVFVLLFKCKCSHRITYKNEFA